MLLRGASLVALVLAGCAAPQRSAPALTATEELSQADVQGPIAASKPALHACVAANRAREPDSRGKLTVQFHILQTGETRDVQARGAAPPQLAACITEVFVAMRFRPHHGDPEPVIWPMNY